MNYIEIENDKEKVKEFTKSFGESAMKQFKNWGEKARKIHNRNKHKIDSPYNINLTYPMK